jgi:hypothetical protein
MNQRESFTEKDLDGVSKIYKSAQAPVELKRRMIDMSENTITRKQGFTFNVPLRFAAAAVAVCVIFVGTVNVFPSFAASMSSVPILGAAAQFLTFGKYDVQKPSQSASAEISQGQVSGLGNKQLETGLNAKYEAQAQELYKEFMAKVDAGATHDSVWSGYDVVANNGTTLSIQNAVVEAQGDSVETRTYDTIDVQKGLYITLPSLFKDDAYIADISANIKEQISQREAGGQGTFFDSADESFSSIAAEQQFYINNDGQLVIEFDELSIAPAYMGCVEFTIPTSAIANDLASTQYIH